MRAVAAVAVVALTLTSCTDSPEADPEPAPSAPVSVPTADAAPTRAEPVSLPCGKGAASIVVGARKKIEGLVAGRPLTSPRSRVRNNKILWVARPAGRGDLQISASLNGTDLQVLRHVEGGPGPSIINVPRAGCWTFAMTWADQHDLVAVRYLHLDRSPAASPTVGG